MENVLGQVLLPAGDEDLGAGDLVGTVLSRHGLGTEQAEIGAALGLGETHHRGPGAVDDLRQIAPLQRLVGMGAHRDVGPPAQSGIKAERQVGRAQDLLEEHAHRVRQTLSPVLGIAGK